MHKAASLPRPREWWALALLLPMLALMALFYVVPLVGEVVNSFRPFTTAGIDYTRWTLENYRRLFDPHYLQVFLRTLKISAIITVITCVVAYPVAWRISRSSPRVQAALLLVFMSPWLVNVVVKAFGISLLIADAGILNSLLLRFGLVDAPLRILYTETAIVIGLVHGHFLFVLLPLWAAMTGLDRNLFWAAANLGAKPHQLFLLITLPLTLAALATGAVINFTMNLAAFATPVLLGGSRTQVVSYVAYQVNLTELNWPFGGAIAVALLVLTLVPLALVSRAFKRGKGATAKPVVDGGAAAPASGHKAIGVAS